VIRQSGAAAKVLGGLFLVGVFAGIEALVVAMQGAHPAAFAAAALGGFLGLVSLTIELGLLARSARTFHAQGVQATFMSFMMRLVVVAPVTLLLMKYELGMDPTSFALSYCATFFLYMCWLTWVTYHAPVQYRPKASASRIVVRDNRRSHAQPKPTAATKLPDATTWGGLR
jgi:hypothetical protein